MKALTLSETGSFDYFDADGCPLVIDRNSGAAWAWGGGNWHSYLGLVYQNYAEKRPLQFGEFLRLFPDVVLTITTF